MSFPEGKARFVLERRAVTALLSQSTHHLETGRSWTPERDYGGPPSLFSV